MSLTLEEDESEPWIGWVWALKNINDSCKYPWTTSTTHPNTLEEDESDPWRTSTTHANTLEQHQRLIQIPLKNINDSSKDQHGPIQRWYKSGQTHLWGFLDQRHHKKERNKGAKPQRKDWNSTKAPISGWHLSWCLWANNAGPQQAIKGCIPPQEYDGASHHSIDPLCCNF